MDDDELFEKIRVINAGISSALRENKNSLASLTDITKVAQELLDELRKKTTQTSLKDF